MKKFLRRFGGTAALCAAGWLGGDAPATAQSPGVLYTKHTNFRMPIQIDPESRRALQEIQLHVREPGSADWREAATGSAMQDHFRFQAGGDGTYHFGFVTVGLDGQPYPPDLSAMPPAVTVVVDTEKPTVGLRSKRVANGDNYLYVTLEDPHPDPATVRVEFQDQVGDWRPLELYTGNYFHVPSGAGAGTPVRVTAGDLAGNSTTSDLTIPALPRPESTVATEDPASLPLNMRGPYDRPEPTPEEETGIDPALLGAPQITENADVPQPATPDVRPPELPRLTPPEADPQPEPAVPELDPEPIAAPPVDQPAPPEIRPTVLNSAKFSLDYAVEDYRLTALTRVEFWHTRDQGATWQPLGDDPDRRSPALLSLPGEGVYGVLARVSSGESEPPAGTEPEFWLEVDTSEPIVSLRPPTIADGTISIVWTALDRNLTAEPISLYYAEQEAGPWRPIAEGVPNDGIYRWKPAPGVGPKVYLRLKAADSAGNSGTYDAPTPVMLGDAQPNVQLHGLVPPKIPGAK